MGSIRPVLLPPILLEAVGFGIIVVIVLVLLMAAHLGGLAASVLLIAAIPFTIVFGASIWVRVTEEYDVEDDSITIKRGWIHMETHRIPVINVANIQVISPILLRPFGVGHVRIFTSDGLSRTMKNVKAPKELAQKIGIR